jgi:hypothetical protein
MSCTSEKTWHFRGIYCASIFRVKGRPARKQNHTTNSSRQFLENQPQTYCIKIHSSSHPGGKTAKFGSCIIRLNRLPVDDAKT